MCNCYQEKIERLEKKLPVILKDKDSGFVKLNSLHSTNLVLSMDGSTLPPFFIDLEASYERKSKKGKSSDKKMPVRLTPTHCPFCGEKYDTE